ncbi:hypothetical protein Verru16b_00700 [Lacunisphaera limnophila]|uniref:Uncharacterized protein n=1 Tax=Lacunisphaera limnophila TaxID=1838286 RepID=A0A1D8ARX5_9BACT|nr:hypothetical protein [Lacunisphaera limnophila]AOS43648.1 hypothetical protein Verru16b_00700 [Lacunisphaera limnophila]
MLGLALPVAVSLGAEDDFIPPSGVKFETLKFKPIPAYRPGRGPDGNYETLRRAELVAELRLLTGVKLNERGTDLLPAPVPRISCRFELYSAVDDAWFAEFNEWFHRELWDLGLTYRKEDWDCDDFSLALNALADLALLQAGEHPAPQLIGRLIVRQVKPWGGTPAGGVHEITLYRSGSGWYVAEPQTRAIIALRDYPNRQHIQEILFN